VYLLNCLFVCSFSPCNSVKHQRASVKLFYYTEKYRVSTEIYRGFCCSLITFFQYCFAALAMTLLYNFINFPLIFNHFFCKPDSFLKFAIPTASSGILPLLRMGHPHCTEWDTPTASSGTFPPHQVRCHHIGLILLTSTALNLIIFTFLFISFIVTVCLFFFGNLSGLLITQSFHPSAFNLQIIKSFQSLNCQLIALNSFALLIITFLFQLLTIL
jgi:hypothetical protein